MGVLRAHAEVRRRGGELRGFVGDDRMLRAFHERRCARRGRAHAVARGVDFDHHLDAIRRGARCDRGVDRLAADAREVVRRWIEHRALDDVAHERERDAERRDHLRVARDAVRETELLRGVRDERRRAASAADQDDVRAVERVVGDQLVQRRAQARRSAVQDRAGELFGAEAERGTGALAREPCGRGVPVRERVARHDAEHVRGAGRRDGDPRAVACDERDEAGAEIGPRIGEQRGIGEHGVAVAGDVRRTRADIDDAPAGDARERTACDGDRAHVQRAQQRSVAADARRTHLRLPAPNHRAVGAGPADLDEDAVGDVLVKQRARDPRGRTGQHREDRAAFDLGDVHDAAVTAHDHQRRGDARVRHRARGHARRAQHARQDRCVERRCARPRAQAVLRRHFGAAGRREAAVARRRNERMLALRPVHRKGLADGDRLHAGFAHRVQHVRIAPVEPRRCEPYALGKRERREAREEPRHGPAE